MYVVRFHLAHTLISVIDDIVSEERATFNAPGALHRRKCRVSMPDVSHPQTHNEQLSRVEVLEMKTRQADEV